MEERHAEFVALLEERRLLEAEHNRVMQERRDGNLTQAEEAALIASITRRHHAVYRKMRALVSSRSTSTPPDSN